MDEEKSQTEIVNKMPRNSDATVSDNGKISLLEAELKDIRERYLQMSIQYAEVEVEREELVMKLNSTNKEKRWFL
ncbi:putative myosin-11 [Cocos nucifera]|uniref:Putative myosin-11 n=1 Tax=Cocos nucifera TaxID=13894 RepID=A0A8K0N8P4_COCNU|nr:putative myosin-11 [Cocos nucifera]